VRSVSSVRSHEGSCTNKQIPSIIKRITNLKKSAVCLEHSLPVSFQNVRGELDVLWNNLESIKHLISGSPQDHAGSTPLFQGHHSLNSTPPLEMLLPSALQVLMRQVVDELRSLGFVTRDKMEARGTTGPDQAVTDQLSGLGRWLGLVERQFTESDGTLSKMEGRLSPWRTGVPRTPLSTAERLFKTSELLLRGSRPSRTRSFPVLCQHGHVGYAVCQPLQDYRGGNGHSHCRSQGRV
jgi:hypothetical protein